MSQAVLGACSLANFSQRPARALSIVPHCGTGTVVRKLFPTLRSLLQGTSLLGQVLGILQISLASFFPKKSLDSSSGFAVELNCAKSSDSANLYLLVYLLPVWSIWPALLCEVRMAVHSFYRSIFT